MVFILPPSFETLEKRIRKRGDDKTLDIETRLRNARKEIKAAFEYDYWVVNDTLETALGEIEAIISAERRRRDRHEPGFLDGFTGS